MDVPETALLYVGIYKIISLLVGALFGYMGYKLFISGVWGDAGDLKAKFEDSVVVLKSAAPGTFFALFGTLIVLLTVFKGWKIDIGNGYFATESIENDENYLPKDPP